MPQTCWASAQEYRHLLFTAGRHEGRAAERYLERVPDPHLRLFAQIELAAALAGLPRISGAIVGSAQGRRPTDRREGWAPRKGAGRDESEFQEVRAMFAALRQSTRKPDLTPSFDPVIEPSGEDAGETPSGGSGPDFWVIRDI